MMDEIEAEMPDIFDYKFNRSVSDYIYSSEKLVNLTGKEVTEQEKPHQPV